MLSDNKLYHIQKQIQPIICQLIKRESVRLPCLRPAGHRKGKTVCTGIPAENILFLQCLPGKPPSDYLMREMKENSCVPQFFQFSLRLSQPGKSILSQRFIEDNRNGIRQVQGTETRILSHRNPDCSFRM